jgi:hypothetical protein
VASGLVIADPPAGDPSVEPAIGPLLERSRHPVAPPVDEPPVDALEISRATISGCWGSGGWGSVVGGGSSQSSTTSSSWALLGLVAIGEATIQLSTAPWITIEAQNNRPNNRRCRVASPCR